MKRPYFHNLTFVTSATKPAGYAKHSYPEIVCVGRSNVGKSTLLNHLFQSKGVAKTSSTPGKTRLINFFTTGDSLSIVDLPGYGYAKGDTRSWGAMLETYLKERPSLKLILFLLDIRRTPSEHDMQMATWLHAHDIPTLLVLTKVDKVKSNEKAKQTALIRKTLGLEDHPFVHYSATKNCGRKELIHEVAQCLS